MISLLEIYQENNIGSINLMAVHSPLIYLIDATFTGDAPDFIYCEVYDGTVSTGELLGEFRCIPYKDISSTKRRFLFIADSILRGYMDSFEDFEQTNDTLVYVENIVKRFTLNFADPDENATAVESSIQGMNGVSQFGESPCKEDIYNNEDEMVVAVIGKPCYIYFYNNDKANVLDINLT